MPHEVASVGEEMPIFLLSFTCNYLASVRKGLSFSCCLG